MNIIMSRPIQHVDPHRLLPIPLVSPQTPGSPLDFTDRIPFKEIQLSNETLGSGSFGTVVKGYWRGRHVAVKQFKTREEIDSFLVEVKQLSCVKHPNIVTLYGASNLSDTAYLIMEYAEGGSLNHLLHECRQQEYDLRHACSWAMQTARGVAYLHSIRPKPIMHRDLKPANLLLFNRGKILKICDFGTACAVRTQMTNNTGSASYMAPEVFATSNYLEYGDVYSWGIIYWEIMARQQPYSLQYSNPYQILWLVKQEGIRPSALHDCPDIIWDLITRSWHKDPKARPTMAEVAAEMEKISSLASKSSRTCGSPQRELKSPHNQWFSFCAHDKSSHIISQANQTKQSFHLPSFDMMKIQNRTSISNKSIECYTNERRELSNHQKALSYELEMLQMRACELEKPETDEWRKSSLLDILSEYERLKEETEFKRQKLHSLRSNLIGCRGHDRHDSCG